MNNSNIIDVQRSARAGRPPGCVQTQPAAAAGATSYSVVLTNGEAYTMTFKKVLKANNSGSIKVIIPHDVTGPNGEDIEAGGHVTLKIMDYQPPNNDNEGDS